MRQTLPFYPTISWRYRRGNGESKTHYTSDYRKTLCGRRIPSGRESGDGEMCERCIQIAEKEGVKSV
jgi:hypothetical protein